VHSLAQLLPAGTTVRAYGAGRANARMTGAAAGIIVGFAVVYALVAILAGRLLLPGFLLLLLFVSSVKPLRGLAVTGDRMVVASTSAWNGRPKAVLTELPVAAIAPANVQRAGRGAVRVSVGSDVVRLRVRDYERLQAAAGTVDAPRAEAGGSAMVDGSGGPASVPGWYPLDQDEYHRGYWSGSAWTSFVRWNGSSWVDEVTSAP
jgi:hypothetical protein